MIQQVTSQSPEFIPSKVTSSPNFYTPYSSGVGGNNVTPVKPSASTSSAYAITPSKGDLETGSIPLDDLKKIKK